MNSNMYVSPTFKGNLQKRFKTLYHKLYMGFAGLCTKHQLYKRNGLIRIYDVSTSSRKGINFTVKGYSQNNKKRLPDFFIDDAFQSTLLARFADELDEVSWSYPYGIIELENASFAFPYIIHRIGNVLVSQGVGDSAHCLCQPRYMLSFLSTLLPKKKSFDAVVLLPLPFLENYYHWTIETLPRLKMISDDQRFNQFPIVIPKERCPSFVFESIALAGFSDRVLVLENGGYKAKRLIIPTLFAPRSELSQEGVQWLNDKILDTETIDKTLNIKDLVHERIFISRDDADTRRVLNSSELDRLLAKFQIKKIKMTDYTVREQAVLFHYAKLIIGLHGAALANVVYGKRDAILLELFMEGLFTKAFYNLARFKEMRYGCLLCRQERGDMVIDIGNMEKLISNLLY